MISSCLHHARTDRPLLRQSCIRAAHSCSFTRCFNSALVIPLPPNMTVTERFATSRYYCFMPVHARLGLTLTQPAGHNGLPAGLYYFVPLTVTASQTGLLSLSSRKRRIIALFLFSVKSPALSCVFTWIIRPFAS